MAIDVVIIGAGGFGREALDVIEAHNRAGAGEPFNVLGVIDDCPSRLNLERLNRRGYKVIGDVDSYLGFPSGVQYLVGVGAPQVRARIAERCDASGKVAATVVHPSASVGSDRSFGRGTIVCGSVQVSTNVKVGRHVHLNPGSIVGHDTSIGDSTSLNPGAIVSGDVTVGDRVLIGAGAVVLQQLRVGADSIVGASACVTHDVAPGVVVKGVPARSRGSLSD